MEMRHGVTERLVVHLARLERYIDGMRHGGHLYEMCAPFLRRQFVELTDALARHEEG
jgi:hypothetical protein